MRESVPPFMGSLDKYHQAFLGHGMRPSPVPLPGPGAFCQPSVALSDSQQAHSMRTSPHPLAGVGCQPSINPPNTQYTHHLPYSHLSVESNGPQV